MLMDKGGRWRPKPLAQAREHLDLSAVPLVVREERGLILSQQLVKILRNASWQDNERQLDPSVDRVWVYRQPSGYGIAMQRQADGRWLVSADSVTAIPEMTRVLEEKGRILRPRYAALDFTFAGLDGQQWLGLAVLPLLAYLAGLAVALLAGWGLKVLVQRRHIEQVLNRHPVARPLGWFVSCLIFWLGVPSIGLPDRLLMVLVVLVKILAVLFLLVTLFRLIDSASEYAERYTARSVTKYDDMLVPLARRTLKISVAVIGVLTLAQNLSIEVWSIFAGFSIVGAMVALAGQDMVKNIFGSITIFLDQPFRVGDTVKVEGIEGTILEVGFRSTKLLSPSGSTITLPNARLLTAAVDNRGVSTSSRRFSQRIRLAWATPPEKLEQFLAHCRELIAHTPAIAEEGVEVRLDAVNGSALELAVGFTWAVPNLAAEQRERHDFLAKLHRSAAELGVALA